MFARLGNSREMQKKLWIRWTILLQIYVLSSFLVSSVDAQKDGSENKCAYDFRNHSITTIKETETFCAKVFQHNVTWDEANALCRITYSHFTNRIPQNSSLHLELLEKGITVLWIGIRRKAHFFVTEATAKLFKEKEPMSPDSWGAHWSANAVRVNDCVVLNLTTGELVTELCSSRLPFVCDRRGMPDTGHKDSLCPDKWNISYPLSTSGKKCISWHKAESHEGAEKVCNDDQESRLAKSHEYEVLRDSGTFLFQTSEAYWVNKENSGSCVFTFMTTVEPNVTSPKNCSKPLPFICVKEYETENVQVWITYRPSDLSKSEFYPPDLSKSGFISPFPSNSTCKSNSELLTCNVKIDGRIPRENNQLLFHWYKEDLMIKKLYVYRIGHLLDPMRKNPSISIIDTQQGSYNCEVRIPGSSKSYSSPKVDLFYSDIATYVIVIEGIAPTSIRDYSDHDFGEFLVNFGNSTMDLLAKKLKYRKSEWDFQSISTNDSSATMKVLLYIHRDDTEGFDDEKAYQEVKKLYEENSSLYSSFFGGSDIILTVNSADVCFNKEAKSSDTCSSDVTWPNSKQTLNVLSDPICLDGRKRLVQRKCKASLEDKAKWSAFSCSSCEILQKKVQDAEFLCSDGYAKLKNTNLCFKIYFEGRDWNEANNICLDNSGYMLNEPLDGIDVHATFWISYKYFNGKIQQVGKKSRVGSEGNIIARHKPQFHCVTVILENGNHTLQVRNCSEKLPFVCLKDSFELISSVKFSNTWTKLSTEEPCYYFSNNAAYKWKESKNECQQIFPNAHLLKGIYKLKPYRYLKTIMHQQFSESECRSLSWWIDFEYRESFLRNSSIHSEWEYTDWHPYTDFNWNVAYGAVTLFPDKEIHWILRDSSSKFRYICEIEKCSDKRPTQAYIEDRSNSEKSLSAQNYISTLENFILKCIPSGWFLTGSISWYKDGILLNTSSDQFSFSYHSSLSLEEALVYEGYYSCSVDQIKPSQREFSSKVLLKIPEIHTFVLSLQSRNENYIKDCVHFMLLETAFSYYENTSLHICFKNNFEKTFPNSFHFLLRNISCNSSYTDVTIHIYYRKGNENEEEILKVIQSTDFFELYQECDFEFDSISVKSTDACYKEEIILNNGEKLMWPTTHVGETAVPDKICLTERGALLERRCEGDFNTGAVWSPVSLSACRNVKSGVTQELYQLLHTDVPAFFSPSSPLLALSRIKLHPEELQPADVQLIAEVLAQSSSQQSFEPQVLASVAETINNLMEVPAEILQQTANSSNRIIESFEHIAHNIDTRKESLHIAYENLAVSIEPLATSSYIVPNSVFLQNWSQNLTTFFNASVKDLTNVIQYSEAGVVLPPVLVTEKLKGNSDRVVYAVHQNINFVKNVTVVAAVVHISFGDSSVYDVNPPVELFFKVNESVKDDYRSYLKCVFWDQRLNNNYGDWSYKGCILNQSKDDLISCSCNHLTSFTLILDFQPNFVLQHVHKAALTLITYIGCSLSCFGLGVIILTFFLFREWRKSMKNKALFNLSACLICFLLLFMSGVNRTHSKPWCIVIAVILHYLLLSSFTWMLVSAFLMYLSLVKVLATYIPCLIQKAVLFAYGVPAVIVVAVLGYKHQLYYQENFCWLSQEAFYYAIATPILLMLTANFVIFGLILYANTCGKSTYLRTNQNMRKLTIARAKALFCVSILLGLSWIFGFLAIGEAKTVFQYLFAITTTLQGFFCFIFFIVRQKSARQLWMNCVFPSSAEKMSRISHITGSTVSNRIHHNVDMNNDNLYRSVIFRARTSYVPYT